jgi:hypothetical protein
MHLVGWFIWVCEKISTVWTCSSSRRSSHNKILSYTPIRVTRQISCYPHNVTGLKSTINIKTKLRSSLPSKFIPSTPMSSPCHYEVFRTLKFRHTLHIPLRSAVFKLSSAGDTQVFHKHISFIMKLVNTILITVWHLLCFPPHTCLQSALLYFKYKSLFFHKCAYLNNF